MITLLAQLPDTSLLPGGDTDRFITVLLAVIALGVTIITPAGLWLLNLAQKQRKRAEIAEMELVRKSIVALQNATSREFNAVRGELQNLKAWMEKIETKVYAISDERAEIRERLVRLEHNANGGTPA